MPVALASFVLFLLENHTRFSSLDENFPCLLRHQSFAVPTVVDSPEKLKKLQKLTERQKEVLSCDRFQSLPCSSHATFREQ
jgi:hypothetical protein